MGLEDIHLVLLQIKVIILVIEDDDRVVTIARGRGDDHFRLLLQDSSCWVVVVVVLNVDACCIVFVALQLVAKVMSVVNPFRPADKNSNFYLLMMK